MVKKNAAFSLIELLVVIAIIGILASIGAVGYNSYITRSQEQASLADFNQLGRIIRQDGIALQENLGVNSAFISGLSQASLCEDWRDRIVSRINDDKENSFDDGVVAVDGNNCGSGATQCTLESDGTKSWKQGQFLIFCANECSAVGAADFRIKACLCRTDSTCQTTIETADDKCGTPPDGKNC